MSKFVHGDNIRQKETHRTKYRDAQSQQYLAEIRTRYEGWKAENLALAGPVKEEQATDRSVISRRVELFNSYKNFLDQQIYAEHFDSRSNLHSSALEELMYFLFKDLAQAYSTNALIGKAKAFKDLSFCSDSYSNMLSAPGALLEKKDYDFVIGSTINAEFQCKGQRDRDRKSFGMPAVAIECKTYLDKTQLDACSQAVEQLKKNNPNALYIIVAERLKLTEEINLQNYKVDQIYILRKERNVDREVRLTPGYVGNPIFEDVVWDLFCKVRNYLSADWSNRITDGLQRGYLL